MLQLLDEEVCQQVNRIVHSAHELLQFDLADLDDEDGAALLVDTVEAVRTQGLDLRVLRKFKVEDGVNILLFAPCQVQIQVLDGLVHVESVALKEAAIKMLIEHKLLDFVDNFL